MGYSQGGDYLTVTFSIRFVLVISFFFSFLFEISSQSLKSPTILTLQKLSNDLKTQGVTTMRLLTCHCQDRTRIRLI